MGACVASVVNFKFNYSYTAEQIAKVFNSTTGLGMETIINKMNSTFSIGYKYGNYENCQKNVWTSLNKHYPVVGGFLYTTGGGGHAMVISGMHYGYSFNVMDPLDVDNKYRVGQISGTGSNATFSILSWTGGDVMVLAEYGYKV